MGQGVERTWRGVRRRGRDAAGARWGVSQRRGGFRPATGQGRAGCSPEVANAWETLFYGAGGLGRTRLARRRSAVADGGTRRRRGSPCRRRIQGTWAAWKTSCLSADAGHRGSAEVLLVVGGPRTQGRRGGPPAPCSAADARHGGRERRWERGRDCRFGLLLFQGLKRKHVRRTTTSDPKLIVEIAA